MLPHVFCRIVYNGHTRIIEGGSDFFYKNRVDFKLKNIAVYPIPDMIANSIWGCIILYENTRIDNNFLNDNQLLQSIHNQVFLPLYSDLHPVIDKEEFKQLFSDDKFIIHPDFGLFRLEEPIQWQEIITPHEPIVYQIVKPIEADYIPQNILSIRVEQIEPQDELDNLINKVVPKTEKFDDKPLTVFEKARLLLLRSFFSSEKNDQGDWNIEKKESFQFLEKIASLFGGKGLDNIKNRLELDLEELEKRNNSEMDKLLDLLRKNPELALKYAIPIDINGTGRGDNLGSFTMSKIWSNFDLFSSLNTGGGSFHSSDHSTFLLQLQYQKTAEEFIKAGNYEKAAFIYMKLLRNYHLAASTLEKGELYSIAASIYLKYCQNKQKAAECYEKAKMIQEAINLYNELGSKEKVGDLYLSINCKSEGYKFYQFVVDEYLSKERYVSASLLLKNKMNDTTTAQNLLLTGWKENKDSFNCLNLYLNNINDKKAKLLEIERIFINDLAPNNKTNFVKVLKTEYKKNTEEQRLKDMAYELISSMAVTHPEMVDLLVDFNKDSMMRRDIWRFKSPNK